MKHGLATVDCHAVEQAIFSTLYKPVACSLNLTTVHSYPLHVVYFVLILEHSPMHVYVTSQRRSTDFNLPAVCLYYTRNFCMS
jgi:hypothetical protein